MTTVLLVEDNDAVRVLIRRILHHYDCQVLEARNADEALEHCRNHPEPIELLLTDVMLPQTPVGEMVEEMATLRPDLKVLFMSGSPSEVLEEQGLLKPGWTLLEKPFRPDTLLDTVRRILQS